MTDFLNGTNLSNKINKTKLFLVTTCHLFNLIFIFSKLMKNNYSKGGSDYETTKKRCQNRSEINKRREANN